jgi:hypothetical protein
MSLGERQIQLRPSRNKSCDIFIRSYYKDFDWLAYCLASIDKFCSGFRSVIVVVPRSSWPSLHKLRSTARNVQFMVCRDYLVDYLGQQVTKLHADLFTDSDLICHVDSDCIFTRPVSPGDLLQEGRVRILMCLIANLGYRSPWQRSTEKFLGWSVTYDFMQNPPFTFPRWLYTEIRKHALQMHGVSLRQYVISRPRPVFSEFNVLGAYAYERHRELFQWVDLQAVDRVEYVCRYYWSGGGLTPRIRREIEAILSM